MGNWDWIRNEGFSRSNRVDSARARGICCGTGQPNSLGSNVHAMVALPIGGLVRPAYSTRGAMTVGDSTDPRDRLLADIRLAGYASLAHFITSVRVAPAVGLAMPSPANGGDTRRGGQLRATSRVIADWPDGTGYADSPGVLPD